MQKTEFLTIYGTYSNLEVVKATLPSVIEETISYKDARLIVHDSTKKEHGQDEKWTYLREMEQKHGFFLILSTNLSMAHARNMCLHVGQELYAPEYIAMMEDDHGYKKGLIENLVKAMKDYYGKTSPNGLKFGLFTGCLEHRVQATSSLGVSNHKYVEINQNTEPRPGVVGGVNSCFRCAPVNHWMNILKGYDTDEYNISTYQTGNLNLRNYHKGFTSLVIENGELLFNLKSEGRGNSSKTKLKLWDNIYSKSDPRSQFLGKEGVFFKNTHKSLKHIVKSMWNNKK